jgi:CRISPR-associated endonuclease Csn1
MKKFVNGIYRNRKPDKFGLQLKEGETKFNALSCLKQFYVLKQIILLVQMKSRGVDLSDIGEAKGCGESKLSRRLSDYTEAVLINQSVTGLFESRIDLLKV